MAPCYSCIETPLPPPNPASNPAQNPGNHWGLACEGDMTADVTGVLRDWQAPLRDTGRAGKRRGLEGGLKPGEH